MSVHEDNSISDEGSKDFQKSYEEGLMKNFPL